MGGADSQILAVAGSRVVAELPHPLLGARALDAFEFRHRRPPVVRDAVWPEIVCEGLADGILDDVDKTVGQAPALARIESAHRARKPVALHPA